jgi:hypothetical protein
VPDQVRVEPAEVRRDLGDRDPERHGASIAPGRTLEAVCAYESGDATFTRC